MSGEGSNDKRFAAKETLADYRLREIPGHPIAPHILARMEAEAQGLTSVEESAPRELPQSVAGNTKGLGS